MQRFNQASPPTSRGGGVIPNVYPSPRRTPTETYVGFMLMWRSYEEAYSVEKMLNELVQCSGTQFDPEIASAAVGWCQSHLGKLILPGRVSPTADQLLQANAVRVRRVA